MIVTVLLIIGAVLAGIAAVAGAYPFGVESGRISGLCAAVSFLCAALAFWHGGQ